VEIEVSGPPLEIGYCHCASCRAYSGNPVGAFLLWKSADVRVVKGNDLLGHFNKSGMSDRQFCTRCGGHLMSVHPALGITDVRPAVIPGIAFKPQVHLNYAEAVVPMKDGLPKLKDFPAHAGGCGEIIPDRSMGQHFPRIWPNWQTLW
jgi:hypothetical protein